MGRLVDLDLLVSSAEIAERLGVEGPRIVYLWMKRYPDFPAPVKVFGRTGAWLWTDVEKWARATKRLPYRPSPRPTRGAGREQRRR